MYLVLIISTFFFFFYWFLIFDYFLNVKTRQIELQGHDILLSCSPAPDLFLSAALVCFVVVVDWL